MPELTDLSYVRALCEKYDFALSKGFGQNFIVNPGLPPKIVDASGVDKRYGVLEIGPGIGVLTRELAKRAAKVVSIEVDERLPPLLAETMAGVDNFKLVLQDVLKVDLKALIAQEFPGMPVAVCANLPYNITTPFLTACVRAGCFRQLTVLIQKEVALRICAKPGTADYGAFSLLMQYYTVPELLFEVPNSCFMPPPKVTSAVVRCVTRKAPPVQVRSEEAFWRTVRAGFALRRKTLVNSLQTGWQLPKEQLAAIVAGCGLSPTVRGEALGLEEYARLSDALLAAAGE